MSGQPKKLRMEEGEADTATRSPPKKSRTTQTIPKKKKLKSEAEKVKEKQRNSVWARRKSPRKKYPA